MVVPSNATYALQVTAKAGTGSWVELSLSDYSANSYTGWCNLTTGTTGSTRSIGLLTAISVNISSLGGGWYTCTVTGSTGTLTGQYGGQYFYDLRIPNADLTDSGTSGQMIDIWHPQIFFGSTAYAWGTTVPTKKFTYFGFEGDPANRYRAAQSDDGITWYGYNGVWYPPFQRNAPQVFIYNKTYYLHIANASDGDLDNHLWQIGQVTPDGTVTTIATIDWASKISGVDSCFSGGPILDAGVQYIMIPCSIGDWHHSLAYLTHMVGGDPTQWSDPQLVTTDLTTGSYDFKPRKIGAYYYMWSSREGGAGGLDLSKASSLAGPYTAVTPSSIRAFPSLNIEGPTMFSTGPSSWRLIFEQLQTASPGHKLWYSDCNTFYPDACTWTAPAAVVEDQLYRHGSIIPTPGWAMFPMPGAVATNR